MSNQTEAGKIGGRVLVDIFARRVIDRRMIAKGEGHVAACSSILEAGGNADGEDGRLVRRWVAGGVVVDEADGRATKIIRAILERGWILVIWEDGRERSYG